MGYQCSNFYRQLIKDGELHDSNYVKDKNGKWIFLFRDKQGQSTLGRAKRVPTKVTRKSKRERLQEIDITNQSEEEEEEEVSVLPVRVYMMDMISRIILIL